MIEYVKFPVKLLMSSRIYKYIYIYIYIFIYIVIVDSEGSGGSLKFFY